MSLITRRGDDFESMSALYRGLPGEGNYTSVAEGSRASKVKLFAPHGGCIEPGTDALVLSLAAKEFDYFLFRGTRKKDCYRTLHVTSAHYDEPACVRLAREAFLAVSVHGCESAESFLEIGGGNAPAAASLGEHLRSKGYRIVVPPNKRRGEEAGNFINLCRTQGVQIELSGGFRSELFPEFPKTDQRHPKMFGAFVADLREWLLMAESTMPEFPPISANLPSPHRGQRSEPTDP